MNAKLNSLLFFFLSGTFNLNKITNFKKELFFINFIYIPFNLRNILKSFGDYSSKNLK